MLEKSAARAGIALATTVFFTISIIVYLGDEAYLWVKAMHVVAVVSWMAGMLYLPRLFVYHCNAKQGSELSETFKIMERRLFEIIMNPAMAIAWALGLWMAWQQELYESGWFIVKFILVVLMSGMHGYLRSAVRNFAADRNTKSARHWRIVNEVPALLAIGIVILAIVKPF